MCDNKTEDPAVTAFRDYLRIKTVHPTPDYDSALTFLKAEADKLSLEFSVTECVPGKPLVVMTWKGLDPSLPSVLLNSHMDVVTVEPENWDHDPFEAYKAPDGKIYGRGTQDMKSVGIQYLYAIKRMQDKGIRLTRTVHVSWVADEELGGTEGLKLFVDTEAYRKLNVGCAMDEGLANPSSKCTVCVGEKAPWWFTIKVTGPAGHGSTLLDRTAMVRMTAILDKCMKFRAQQAERLANGASASEVTTLNVTRFDGGSSLYNVIPAELSIGIDMRIPPTANVSEIEAMVAGWIEGDEEVSIEWFVKSPIVKLTVTDESNPWWVAFSGACDQAGVTLDTPSLFPASSDARFLRALDVPVISFSPMWNTPILLHAHNEYLDESMFLKGVEVYEKVIPALANMA